MNRKQRLSAMIIAEVPQREYIAISEAWREMENNFANFINIRRGLKSTSALRSDMEGLFFDEIRHGRILEERDIRRIAKEVKGDDLEFVRLTNHFV